MMVPNKKLIDYLISLYFRVQCDRSFYTSTCDVFCKQLDDANGHYDCNRTTGQKICLPGWLNGTTNCTTRGKDSVNTCFVLVTQETVVYSVATKKWKHLALADFREKKCRLKKLFHVSIANTAGNPGVNVICTHKDFNKLRTKSLKIFSR